MTSPNFDRDLYSTPIARRISALQDEGRNIWIAGFTPDGRYALIVDADNDFCSVAHVETVNGNGRWECRKAHYTDYASLYHERFPMR